MGLLERLAGSLWRRDRVAQDLSDEIAFHVEERTRETGIKMALGAKRWFILMEILFEAVVLCVVGGALGLLFIWIITEIITKLIDFDIHLSLTNVLIGVLTSIAVGILSGLIPASQASSMDPVEAIRK